MSMVHVAMLVFTAPPLAAVLLSPPGGVQGQRGVQGLPILAAPRAFTSTAPQLATTIPAMKQMRAQLFPTL